MSNILNRRDHYKPFDYPWAFEAYHTAQKMHWLPDEVDLSPDLEDWWNKLNDGERDLLTQLFRFFTQADANIATGYHETYIPAFPHPELRMMMGAFATAEANHMHSYSLLLDTIGMPDTEYKAFQEFEEMAEKHEYMFSGRSADGDPIKQLARDLAKFSAFGEGLQLFSTFAILLSFKERNLMRGMSTIIEWSLNDESLHVEMMIKVFRSLIEENPHIWTNSFKKEIYTICRKMVELEYKFIDLVFAICGDLPNCSAEDVKTYIRNMADRRLLQLGLKPIYGQATQPFDWLEWMLNAKTHTNFFEGRETGYTKGGISHWERAYDQIRKRAILKPVVEAAVEGLGDKTLVIYTKDFCPYCSILKHELSKRRIAFESVDLSNDGVRGSFYENTGTNSMPQVYLTSDPYSTTAPSGTPLGGWDEVSKLLESLPDMLR